MVIIRNETYKILARSLIDDYEKNETFGKDPLLYEQARSFTQRAFQNISIDHTKIIDIVNLSLIIISESREGAPTFLGSRLSRLADLNFIKKSDQLILFLKNYRINLILRDKIKTFLESYNTPSGVKLNLISLDNNDHPEAVNFIGLTLNGKELATLGFDFYKKNRSVFILLKNLQGESITKSKLNISQQPISKEDFEQLEKKIKQNFRLYLVEVLKAFAISKKMPIIMNPKFIYRPDSDVIFKEIKEKYIRTVKKAKFVKIEYGGKSYLKKSFYLHRKK